MGLDTKALIRSRTRAPWLGVDPVRPHPVGVHRLDDVASHSAGRAEGHERVLEQLSVGNEVAAAPIVHDRTVDGMVVGTPQPVLVRDRLPGQVLGVVIP